MINERGFEPPDLAHVQDNRLVIHCAQTSRLSPLRYSSGEFSNTLLPFSFALTPAVLEACARALGQLSYSLIYAEHGKDL